MVPQTSKVSAFSFFSGMKFIISEMSQSFKCFTFSYVSRYFKAQISLKKTPIFAALNETNLLIVAQKRGYLLPITMALLVQMLNSRAFSSLLVFQ